MTLALVSADGVLVLRTLGSPVNGALQWSLEPTISPGNYHIRATDGSSGSTAPQSWLSPLFRIVAPGPRSYVVTAPAPGSLTAGSSYAIAWHAAGGSEGAGGSAAGSSPPVTLELARLLEGAALSFSSISNAAPDVGMYSWAVRSDLPPGVYVVRVGGEARSQPFLVQPPGRVTLLSSGGALGMW